MSLRARIGAVFVVALMITPLAATAAGLPAIAMGGDDIPTLAPMLEKVTPGGGQHLGATRGAGGGQPAVPATRSSAAFSTFRTARRARSRARVRA